MRIVAVLPNGFIEPLLWLHQYDSRYPHPFLFRRPVHLPVGTRLEGMTADAVIDLLPLRP
jgi:hypothetical protein